MNISTAQAGIAIVEDDRDLLDTMLDYLRAAGYSSIWGVTSAEAFYKRFSVEPVSVVILDIGLPGEDGISVSRHLSGLPHLVTIIVSARDALEDRLAGLHAGADRYLVKPVNLAELAANIEAAFRRVTQELGLTPPPEPSASGSWKINKADWALFGPDGKALKLTAREYALLNFLMAADGEVVAKQMIADAIFGARIHNSAERLDVLLARLRKKVATSLGLPLPVKTAHGAGYAFAAPAIQE